MGLKGDVDEVVTTWRKSSWPVKAWLLLSLILGVSSIASLSEEITKWKGFFKDEIEFYREWISTPLQVHVLPLIGLHFTRSSTDFFIVIIIAYGGLIRSAFLVSKIAPVTGPIYLTRKMMMGYVFVYSFAAVIGMIVFVVMSNNSKPDLYSRSPILLACALLIFLFTPLTLLVIHPRVRDMVRFYMIQIVVVFFVVGIMAAINAGLSR